MELPHLHERWPVNGLVISSDGPYIGVGNGCGLQTVKVEHVEGDIAWLQAAANQASTALDRHDLVCLHIPFYEWGLKDGRRRPPSQLVEYLGQVDEQVFGAIHQSVGSTDSIRIVVLVTPCPNWQKDGGSSISPYLVFEGARKKNPKIMRDQ